MWYSIKRWVLFIKPQAHRIPKLFQKKKNPTVGILHIEVGIKGCHTVQNLFYVGMRKQGF